MTWKVKTCFYIQNEVVRAYKSENRFGLPSGGGVTFADEMTLKVQLNL